MNSPIFEIVTTTAGAVSIRNNVVNEIMHNPVGPWAEANALYIEQSQLRRRLTAEICRDELVIFDVGLGAAANAVAALHCAQQMSQRRPLRLVSFERDMDLLQFAYDHAGEFAHFRGFESALKSILSSDQWTGDNIVWQLYRGDFLKTVEQVHERPHLVYFDPYSPKVNNEMWSTVCFQRLRARSREATDGGTILYTYSQATPIRSALLAAGFYVGYGTPTGLKEETTQAATVLSDLASPLAERWLRRWQSSHAAFPLDCPVAEQINFRQLILRHPQFTACSKN